MNEQAEELEKEETMIEGEHQDEKDKEDEIEDVEDNWDVQSVQGMSMTTN